MVEERDIYSKKENAPARNGDLPSVELSPDQIRARTRRTTLAYTALMVGLLGLSTWLVYMQGDEKKTPDAEEELIEPLAPLPPAHSLTNLKPAVVKPRVEIPERPGKPAAPASDEINPEKMAKAMGETRLANDYLHAKDFDRAEEHARAALQIWPGMNAALRLLGVTYTQRGQFEQAIGILEEALRGEPFNAETFNNLAAAYMQKGMMDKAEELLTTSLQVQPGYFAAYLNLGLLHLASGRYQDSADNFEEALRQLPNNINARNNLAVALIRLGRFDEARGHLDTLLAINPDMPAAYFNVAITYVLENDYPKAMEWVRKGAKHCAPVACQQFLADTDFDPLRSYPEFQNFTAQMFPSVGKPGAVPGQTP